VPRENLLGEIGGGWQVAMTTLLHERGTLGFALTGVLDLQVQRLIALAKERAADDPIIRDRVAQVRRRVAGTAADVGDKDGLRRQLGRHSRAIALPQRVPRHQLVGERHGVEEDVAAEHRGGA